MHRYLPLLVLLLFAGCVDDDSDRSAIVEAAVLPTFTIRGEPVRTTPLVQRMQELGVPGVSIAVVIDDDIAWAKGYGLANVEENRPVSVNTLFQAASISKPVAALAALKLVDNGRVDLDGNVNDYLTSWKVPDNAFTVERKVSLRGILAHRAGLTVCGFPGYGPQDPVPNTTGVLDGLGNTDPVRVYKVPGESWRYSGGGFTVMQQLVEDVYERGFADVMREEVLMPIGMTRSTYEQPIPVDRQDDIATGYRSDGTPVAGAWHTYPEQAAAGLWTTPSELARYALEVQRSYRGESNRVLSQALTREMLAGDADEWGLGPGVPRGGERFTHGGSNEGFRSTFTAFIQRGDGVFVMTNSENGGRLAGEIAITVANAYGWSGPVATERIPIDLDEATLERYVGTYIENERGLPFSVTIGERGLNLRWTTGEAALWPTNDSTFFDPEDGQAVSFSRANGELTIVLGNLRAVRQPD